MLDAHYFDCKWLDLYSLANRIKNSTHEVNSVKYFTSRVNNNFEKKQRQTSYIDALSTTPITIIQGQFRSEKMKCQICGSDWYDSKEKMTDVNIATNMLIDAYNNEFEVAFLISGDSDLVPPIKAIKKLFPQKEIIVAFPPERKSNELKSVANSSFALGHKKLQESQFSLEITNKYGEIIKKPASWL
jgi:uncharacterized LabA/DUF88 family protein